MSRADRLDHLIDAAFAKLEDGDVDGAAKKLELARRIDGKHPDVLLLDAEVAIAHGEPERALPLLEKVAKLIPEDPTPLISAAGLHLYFLGDAAKALETVDAALDLCDDEETLVTAVLIRAEALGELDRLPEARDTLAELSTSAIDDPGRQLAIGDAHLQLEDPGTALLWFRRALDDADYGTDALYASGWAYEALADEASKKKAWREVYARDVAAPWPAWRLAEGEFEKIAEEALDELPKRARDLLEHVPMIVADLPAEGLVDDGLDPRVLGLIIGPDRVEQAQLGATGTAVEIFLYAKNLTAEFSDPEELADQIRVTLLHETAHYFGLDEDEVAAAGLE